MNQTDATVAAVTTKVSGFSYKDLETREGVEIFLPLKSDKVNGHVCGTPPRVIEAHYHLGFANFGRDEMGRTIIVNVNFYGYSAKDLEQKVLGIITLQKKLSEDREFIIINVVKDNTPTGSIKQYALRIGITPRNIDEKKHEGMTLIPNTDDRFICFQKYTESF